MRYHLKCVPGLPVTLHAKLIDVLHAEGFFFTGGGHSFDGKEWNISFEDVPSEGCNCKYNLELERAIAFEKGMKEAEGEAEARITWLRERNIQLQTELYQREENDQ